MLDPNMKLISNIDMMFDELAPNIVSWHYANDGKMFAWADVRSIVGAQVIHEANDNNYHRTLLVQLPDMVISVKYRDNQASPMVTHSAYRDLEMLNETVLEYRGKE